MITILPSISIHFVTMRMLFRRWEALTAVAYHHRILIPSTFATANAADMIAMKSKSMSGMRSNRLDFAVSYVENRRGYDITNTFIIHVVWVTAVLAVALLALALYLDQKGRQLTRMVEKQTYLVRSKHTWFVANTLGS